MLLFLWLYWLCPDELGFLLSSCFESMGVSVGYTMNLNPMDDICYSLESVLGAFPADLCAPFGDEVTRFTPLTRIHIAMQARRRLYNLGNDMTLKTFCN